VYCERALKSAGERNTHGGAGAGTFGLRETACTGGCGSSTARLASSGDLAAGGGPGAVIPCWQVTDCALGERLRRSQLACARAAVLLAGHNL
jgi:hypothetical protein